MQQHRSIDNGPRLRKKNSNIKINGDGEKQSILLNFLHYLFNSTAAATSKTAKKESLNALMTICWKGQEGKMPIQHSKEKFVEPVKLLVSSGREHKIITKSSNILHIAKKINK